MGNGLLQFECDDGMGIGRMRPYDAYIPEGSLVGVALGGFHGANGTSEAFFNSTQLKRVADEYHVPIFLPYSKGPSWGTGHDQQYIENATEDFKKRLKKFKNLTTNLVMACGHSQGAGMITRIALHYSDLFFAICPVNCGALDPTEDRPTHKTHVLKINSLRDFDGDGKSRHAEGRRFIQTVAKVMGHRGQPVITTLNDDPAAFEEAWVSDTNDTRFVTVDWAPDIDETHRWQWERAGAGINATVVMVKWMKDLLSQKYDIAF